MHTVLIPDWQFSFSRVASNKNRRNDNPKHTFCSRKKATKCCFKLEYQSVKMVKEHRALKGKIPLLSAVWQIDLGTFVTH